MLIVALGFAQLCDQVYAQAEEKNGLAKDDPKLAQAWKDLEGRWKLVGITERNTYVDHSDNGCGIIIARQSVENYSKKEQTKRGSEFRYQIAPKEEPAHLDMISEPKGWKPSIYKAIYRIDGDKLEIAIYRGGTIRPTSFVNNIFDRNHPLKYEYKRVKEQEK